MQGRGLLELAGEVVEQARGRDGRLQSQPCDQPVNHHMGEPFDLGVDGWDRLVGQLFGELVKEPTRYQLLSDARSWDAGPRVERQVARTDKVRATSLALPRVYARCLPRTRCHRVASRSLGSPCPAQARRTASGAEPWRTAGRCEPGTTMAVHSWGVARAAPGLSPCGLAPGHVAACSRRGRDCLVNRPDLAGQRAPVGAARRRPDLRAGNRGRGRGRAQTGRQPDRVPGRHRGGEYGG